jgi:hypothetical protein
MSSSVSRPLCFSPLVSCTASLRQKASISCATKPDCQIRSAASISPVREPPSRCAWPTSRWYIAASAGWRNSEPGCGTLPSGSHTAAEDGQCERNSACTARIACEMRGTSGKPSRA